MNYFWFLYQNDAESDDGLSVSLPVSMHLFYHLFFYKSFHPFCRSVSGWIIMTGSEEEVEVTGAMMMMRVRMKMLSLQLRLDYQQDKVGN